MNENVAAISTVYLICMKGRIYLVNIKSYIIIIIIIIIDILTRTFYNYP
jgi:hypothetical protein